MQPEFSNSIGAQQTDVETIPWVRHKTHVSSTEVTR